MPKNETETTPETKKTHKGLRVPEYRVLRVLMPKDNGDKPFYPRADLNKRAGFTPLSGSLQRVLVGIKEGSSSGSPHPGIVERGLVKPITLDLDGIKESGFQITSKGIKAVETFIAEHGKAPKIRDKTTCINARYKK